MRQHTGKPVARPPGCQYHVVIIPTARKPGSPCRGLTHAPMSAHGRSPKKRVRRLERDGNLVPNLRPSRSAATAMRRKKPLPPANGSWTAHASHPDSSLPSSPESGCDAASRGPLPPAVPPPPEPAEASMPPVAPAPSPSVPPSELPPPVPPVACGPASGGSPSGAPASDGPSPSSRARVRYDPYRGEGSKRAYVTRVWPTALEATRGPWWGTGSAEIT